jgi:hypothetical protein
MPYVHAFAAFKEPLNASPHALMIPAVLGLVTTTLARATVTIAAKMSNTLPKLIAFSFNFAV